MTERRVAPWGKVKTPPWLGPPFPMRHARVLAAALLVLLAPAASATTVNAGPAEAEVAFAPLQGCSVAVDADLCPAAWDSGQTPVPGDDVVRADRPLDRARLTLRVPDAPEHAVVIEPESYVLRHPGNGHLEGAWLLANDSRPEDLEPFVSFESRPVGDAWVLLVRVVFPTPLPHPLGGEWTGSTVPVYSWDCRWYFSDYAGWDRACSYEGVGPLPNGVRSWDESDRAFDANADLLDCADYDYAPDACPALVLAAELNGETETAWRDAAPNVEYGTGVGRVEAGVAPA